jgi:hypothetical protein
MKFTLEQQAMKAQYGSRGIAYTLSLTLALDGGGWSMPNPLLLVTDNKMCVYLHECNVMSYGGLVHFCLHRGQGYGFADHVLTPTFLWFIGYCCLAVQY